MKNLLPKLRTLGRAVSRIENWPTVLEMRLRRDQRGLRMLRFRNGLNAVCRLGMEDWEVLNEVLLSDGYAKAFNYLRGLGGAPQVLDFGANIGIFSLRVVKEHLAARVYAYEPSPPTIDFFKVNQLVNAPSSERVLLHEFGVGGSTRRTNFFYDPTSPQSAGICYERSNSFEVQIKSFAEIVTAIAGPIALAKIDVEGAEFEIVQETPPEVWRKVTAVSIELHSTTKSAFQSADLLKRLQSYGYSIAQEEFGPSSFFLCRPEPLPD
jgi:FkbM family methyltransferase